MTNMRLRRLILSASWVLVASLFLVGCGVDSVEKSRSKARAAIAKKEFRSAEIHLKNLLQVDPSDWQGRVMLASVYAHSFDWPGAEKELRLALSNGANRNVAVPALLAALARSANAETMIELAESANVDTSEAKADVAYWNAVALQRKSNAAAAKAQFDAALTLNPQHTGSKVGLLRLSALQSAPAAALQEAHALVAAAPRSTDALLLKAELCAVTGDMVAAKESLIAFLEITPNDFVARTGLARLYGGLGELEKAAEQLAAVLKRVPGFYPAWTLKADLELRRNQLDAARDAILQALKLAPDDLQTVAVAANVFLRSGQLEQAETYSRHLNDRAPNNPMGRQLLAKTLLAKGMAKEAFAIAKKLIDGGASDMATLNLAGAAALRLGAYADAGRYFDSAVGIDASNMTSQTGAGLALIGAGQKEVGIDRLDGISAQSPKLVTADYELVSALLRDRKFDAALAVVERIERKDPKAAIAPLLRGRVLLAKGEAGSGARAEFEQALVLDPQLVQALANLAALDLKDSKPKDARARVDKFVATFPNNADGLLLQADLAGRSNASRDDVLAILRRAQASDKGDVRGAIAISRLQRSANKPQDAIAVIQQALQQSPERPGLFEELAAAAIEAGQVELAKSTLETWGRVSNDSADNLLKIARLREAIGDSGGAMAALQRAQSLAPRATQPRIAMAAALLRAGNAARARDLAKALQNDHPDEPVGIVLEAEALGGMNQWVEAAAKLSELSKRLPNDADIAIRRHNALTRSGQVAQADAVLAEAMGRSPRNLRLLLYLAETDLAEKRWIKAVERYNAALEIQPLHLIAMNNLAWVLLQLNDPKALAVAQDAFKLAPESPPVIDTLAVALIAKGSSADASRALELHRKAIELSPRAPELRLSYIKSLLQQGDKTIARKEFDVLVRDFADSAAAKSAIEQLKPKL